MLIPWMLTHAGPAVAFGTPGVFMVIATIVFWLGRGKFAHIKPAGVKNYAAEFFDHEEVWRLRTVGQSPARPGWSFWLKVAFWVLPVPLLFAWIPFVAVLLVWLPPTPLFIAVALLVPVCLVSILLIPTLLDRPRGGSRATQRENIKALANLFCLVPFAAMFWALWQQNFSSWVLQAEHMDRHLFGHEWLPAQIQTVNPAFILIMLPLFSYLIYPAINKVFPLTPLRKFGMGLFTNAAAFAIIAWIQVLIDHGQTPHIIWQILAFVVLTAGEVMVSVTHLEFAYTQAPKKMKSLVMCTYLASVSLGNLFTSGVNAFIQNPDGTVKLQGASYFFFFVKLMLVTAVLFLCVAGFYRGKTYIQDEAQPEPSAS
jgi:dipeptide/tripeptide permease